MALKQLLFIITLYLMVACSSFNSENKSNRDKKTDLYFGQGTEMLVRKDYTKALEYLMEAQKLNPNDSEIQNNLGMAYYLKKRPAKAKLHLSKAIEINPKNSNARNNLASILYREKNYTEAKHQYNKVKEDLIYSHQYRTYYNLALISEAQGDTKNLIALLKESIAEREDYCPAHYKLGEISLERDKLSAAIKHFKNASKGTCYKDPAPLYYQAIIYQRLAAPQKAVGKLSEILDNFDKSVFAPKAKSALDKIMKNNPELREKIQITLDSFKKKSVDRL
jgi:type IV pilus assembly protein PilF